MEASAYDPDFEAPGIEELRPLFPAYDIEEFLAKGGMGALYIGRQKSLDRPVAIKILPREFGADLQFRANFESEAKSMARLNHPNLIGVYDFGEVDGHLFIIMELVDGKSLHHSAHGKVVEQREAARLVAGICQGLSHAHMHGILHRDIKPDNILLAHGPQPKIVDFGLARPMGEGHKPGEIIYGTPGYAAPEVIKNPGAVDHRADVFSAGVVLYELLTAQMPPTPWLPPSSLVHCDAGFDNILRRAAHPSPEMRYGDAAEMAEELEKLVAKLDGPFAGNAAGARGPQAHLVRPATPTVAGTVSPVTPPRKSSAGPIVTVAALVIGLAAAAYFLVLNGTGDPAVDGGESVAPAPEPAPPVDPPPEKPPEPVAIVPVEPAKPPEPDEPPTPEPAAKPPETVAESLTRLREKLLSGDRSELPQGTASRGDAHFLLVDTTRSWDAASRFAEFYGAQLAVLDSKEDLAWAVDQFAIQEPAWLGLSDSGSEGKWYWADGAPPNQELWAAGQPDNTPTTDVGEDFAVILPDGILDDEPGSNERRFILQWAQEGDNKGSLANQLERTGAALQAKKPPIFPAGARNIGGSRFLLVPFSTSWESASSTAKAAGGHLAVPSSEAEAAWLATMLGGLLKPGEACWLGGRLTSGDSPQWAFVTGELFEFIRWLPERPDGDGSAQPFLRLHRPVDSPDQFGCDDADGSAASAHCFVLEWSAPSRRNMPGRDDARQANNARDWLLALREDYAERHSGPYKVFQKSWHKNVKSFVEEIRAAADLTGRGGFGGGLKRMTETYAAEVEKDGRIPDTLPAIGKRLLGGAHESALKKQQDLWDDYKPQFQGALDNYLEEIQLMAGRLQQAGKRDDADYLKREVQATSADGERFGEILNGLSPPVPEE